jgi:hypothetical protein
LMPIMNFMTKYYHRSEQHSRYYFLLISLLKPLSFVLLFSGALLLNSCEEKPTFIGKNILPGNDYVSVNSTDTFNIRSYTMYDYPVSTENLAAPYIGKYYDPYFGTTSCEFISQLRLEQEWVKGDYEVDSVKLVLRIISVKGSTDISKQLRITEISKKLFVDSTYYSNTVIDTTDVGISVGIPPLRNDTVNIVEINLPLMFGEYLIRDQEKLIYSSSVEDFRDYFKGIYMRIPAASETDPLLLGLNVALASTLGDYSDYFILYMHKKDDITTIYNFKFLLDPTKENARFTRIEHNFSTASPDKKFDDIINKPVLDSLSYLQGLNGVYTKIVIPGLEEIKLNPSRGRTAVNKARLFLPIHYDGDNYTSTTIPESVLLRFVNSSGTKEIVRDYYIDDYHEYFDGTLDTTYNMYRFNISNFIQDYLNDTEGLLKPELEVFQSSTELRNVILKANSSKSPIKLEMTLTEF